MSGMEFTRHVLAVPDLARSTAWYRDVLGLALDFEVPGWSFMSRGRFSVMLGECPDAIPPGDLGDHSYFAYVIVGDIDELFHEVAGRGAEICSALADKPWGMREFGVRTVDGHRIMFGDELRAMVA